MTSSASPHGRLDPRTAVLLVIGLAAALLYLAADQVGLSSGLRLITKPLPVLMLALWVSGLRGGSPRYRLAVSVGLLLSALGDSLLELGDAMFLLGLIAFLLGHVAYIVAFLQDTRKLYPFHGAAAYAYGMLALSFLLATGKLGGMLLPVQLYILVITSMLWRASARLNVAKVPRFSAWAGFLGALFFVVSDTVLAFRLFETPVQLPGLVVMITYWLGQLGIAASTLSTWLPANSGGAPKRP